MSWLRDNGIVEGDGKAQEIFEHLNLHDFTNYKNPSTYIKDCWEKFTSKNLEAKSDRSTSGKVYEYIIASMLIKENLLPFFIEAEVKFVPNVRFDFLLYTEQCGPVVLSAKTTLRERYKQADLEALTLKSVHRRSRSFLLTESPKEAENVNKKIENGEVQGIERVIHTSSEDIDQIVKELKKFDFILSPEFKVVESIRIIQKQLI